MASIAHRRRHSSGRRSIGCHRRTRVSARTPSASFTLFSILFVWLLVGCQRSNASGPAIEFTRVPAAVEGGPDKLDIIEGRVTGGDPKLQLVLYAKSGKWWIQPILNEPFTTIRKNSTWTNSTHLGTEYAAMLVQSGFHPATALTEVPAKGGSVVAVATVKGSDPALHVSKTIQFCDYEWRVRSAPSSRGGQNNYEPSNAWTDSSGALHLRISKSLSDWTSAEVALTRSLGYGTYSFVVRDTTQLEPAAVFSILTWDYAGTGQGNSEMDIEISRWGERNPENAQYVIQPFYIPENASRFTVPSGTLTYSFHWEPERVTFRSYRGSHINPKSVPVAEHVFTAGVPSHAAESVRMNLYVLRSARESLEHETEVVVDKFEYLP